MKTLQQELIDFLYWYNDTDFNVIGHSREDVIDEYLKSINSNSAGERRAIGSNEQAEKSCPECKTPYTHTELLINEHCLKCGHPMEGF